MPDIVSSFWTEQGYKYKIEVCPVPMATDVAKELGI